MIGLVIVTHGGLASEFLSAMEHVVGPQRGVAAICIGPEDDMERRRRDIVDAAAAVDDGNGVILLTDMFGGTPSNLAISVMEQTHAEVIAGRIEARGFDIVAAGWRPSVRIALVVDCVQGLTERLPEPAFETVVGVGLPRLILDVRPASAAVTLGLAIDRL